MRRTLLAAAALIVIATAAPLAAQDTGVESNIPGAGLGASDATQLAFAETADGKRTADLEFDLGAFDLYSNLVVARSQAVKVVLTPSQYEQFMKTSFRFYLPIPLPHGQFTLRAGLFDAVANTSGSFQLPLTVPKK